MKDIYVIIPAYNPSEKLFLNFVEELLEKNNKIIVINDGSNAEYNKIFKKLENKNIEVLKHNVNLGKGRAMKTGFNYILNNYPQCKGVVVADCDGQHCVDDIVKCAIQLIKNNSSLILGVRDFTRKDVPIKSKFGNKLTTIIFKFFIGLNIQDTQTGLRGINTNLMKYFMNVKGERYEFETNMLIECKTNNINIIEVPISTIYIEKNKSSHFNPIKDSISIYKLLTKYIISSISSFIIDIILFNLLFIIFTKFEINNSIIISTIISRIISSLYNFAINAKLVFKNINNKSLVKYIILVIIQMLISGFAVEYLSGILLINVIIIKIIVDIIIFICNFIVQREFIFKK